MAPTVTRKVRIYFDPSSLMGIKSGVVQAVDTTWTAVLELVDGTETDAGLMRNLMAKLEALDSVEEVYIRPISPGDCAADIYGVDELRTNTQIFDFLSSIMPVVMEVFGVEEVECEIPAGV